MFNRLNKFQAALALALYSQSALGQYYSNSTSISSNSSSTSVVSSSSGSVSISSSIAETSSSATDILSSITQSASSTSGVSSSVGPSSSSVVSSSVSQSSSSASDVSSSVSQSSSSASDVSSSVSQSASSTSGVSSSGSQSVSSTSGVSSSFPQSASSASTASGSATSNSLSSITSSASSASATASNSLSSSDGTIYLPTTTISGDLTLTGKVIATEGVVVAAGAKLTLLDGDKYSFSADLKVYGDLLVKKSKETYPGTEFDISGENFDVTGNFNAEESAATSASIYSFTPSSFDNSGDISLSLSKSKKGEVTFSPYSNSGAFSFSNTILNGGSVSGLQRRDDTEGSVNNGEINLDNGSTYVIVEPVSGKGTVNIISGNLYLHYPDTFTGQTVVFKGEGVLAVDPTETNATPIPVVGYTGKNQIAITADITALSYDGTTGVLTATQGNRQFSFAIGTGFSSSDFSVSEGIFAGAYAYYLNYNGVVATSAASSSTASGASASVTGSTSFGASVTGSTASTSFGASVTGSTSVYTTTLDYVNATSTVVVSCSETTDSNGNVYTITTTVPCSSTTATITSCDETGCHVSTSTGAVVTETVSSKSYTTATVTHCDDNGCNTKTVTSECSKETAATTISPKSYTTVTVTHCDDNGCNTKTVTSEASKQTSLATSTVTKSAAPTSHTAASSTFTGIVVQSEGMAAGLRTNALSTLAGIFILAFF
ncbi:CGH_1_HP_G0060540.mRNA.1.CDS.1 [Saccharomyces cerevisiae]|nr:CGH_1_HP_G0057530.mRNA.1.CDS.1 [Saccharomyces cerevisiae]CAI4982379.1 CGH_1_HP_G0060540.mRNA.1.CDS.1 [Saccharomyces cerevisiae]CAI6804474.1 CGH_1_HP_G0057530.mRNA.1.CDS.1 [Saccharomyces cerevisiae]CAI6828153.1 CGH_1_HP_G0060540.mRNA.1.CDS.1 [Saccharomyces cerevisiae]